MYTTENYVTLAECDNDLQVLTKCQETRFFAQIKRNKTNLRPGICHHKLLLKQFASGSSNILKIKLKRFAIS